MKNLNLTEKELNLVLVLVGRFERDLEECNRLDIKNGLVAEGEEYETTHRIKEADDLYKKVFDVLYSN